MIMNVPDRLFYASGAFVKMTDFSGLAVSRVCACGVLIEKSVPRVTVVNHSAEPRDVKL